MYSILCVPKEHDYSEAQIGFDPIQINCVNLRICYWIITHMLLIDPNVSDKIVKLIQSYTGIVDRVVWGKY
jgi:hypothetical protein